MTTFDEKNAIFFVYISPLKEKKLAEREHKRKVHCSFKKQQQQLKKNPDSIMTEEATTLPSKQEKQVQNLPGKQILNGFRNFELVLQSQRDHCCSDETGKRTHAHTR